MDIEIFIVATIVALLIISVNFVLVRLAHLDNTMASFVQQSQDSYWEFISGEHGRDETRNAEEF